MRTYWLIPGFSLILLGAGCALSKSQNNQVALEDDWLGDMKEVTPESGNLPSQVMAPEIAIASNIQAEELVKTILLNGGEFFFEPAMITAQPGEELLITFGNLAGKHTFTIDELEISKPMVSGGSVSFTAPDTPGRYTYYCSEGPHKTLGMTGVLVVE